MISRLLETFATSIALGALVFNIQIEKGHEHVQILSAFSGSLPCRAAHSSQQPCGRAEVKSIAIAINATKTLVSCLYQNRLSAD
jgi:hypothetical protein